MSRTPSKLRRHPRPILLDPMEPRRLLTAVPLDPAPGVPVVEVPPPIICIGYPVPDPTIPPPDPAVLSIGPAPSTSYPGGIVTLSAAFAQTAGSDLFFTLSADDIPGNADDIRLVGGARLAPDGSTLGPSSYQIPSSAAPGTYHLVAHIDPLGSPDADPSNDALVGPSITLTTPPALPDLGIADFGVYPVTDIEAGQGAYAPVRALTPNPIPAGTTLRVYLSSDTTFSPDDTLIFSSDPIGGPWGFPPLVFLRAPAYFAPGTYHPIAVIDADNVVAESDETNNTFVANPITVHAPADQSNYVPQFESIDLNGPTSSDGSIPAGARVTLSARLANFDDFYHVPVTFFLSPDAVTGNSGDVPLGTATATCFPLTHEGLGSTSVTLPADLPAGTYHLVAIAGGTAARYIDPNPLTITAAPNDGISIADFSVDTTGGDLHAGDTVPASIKTVAPSNAAPFTVRVYLSEDSLKSQYDHLVASVTINPADPSSTSQLLALRIPYDTIPSLHYRAIAIIDTGGDVADPDNVSVAPETITIQRPADPSAYVPSYIDVYVPGYDGIPQPADHHYAPGDHFLTFIDLDNFAIGNKVPVSLYLSSDDVAGNADDILLGSSDAEFIMGGKDVIPGVRMGYGFAGIFSTLPADLPAGTYHLVAVANNGTPFLSPRPLIVDAQGSSQDAPAADDQSPAQPVTPGSPAHASLTFSNSAGTSPLVGRYNVRLYLSDDPTLSSNDKLFSRKAIRAHVPAGRSATLPLTYTLPRTTKLGTQYLILVADPVGTNTSSARPLSASSSRIQSATKINVTGPHLTATLLSTRGSKLTLRLANDGGARFHSAATIKVYSQTTNDLLYTLTKRLTLNADHHRDLTLTLPTAPTTPLDITIA